MAFGFTGWDQLLYNLSQGFRSTRTYQKTMSIAAVSGKNYHLFNFGPNPSAGTYSGTALARQAVNGGTSPTAGIVAPKNATSPRHLYGALKHKVLGVSANTTGTLLLLDVIAYYPAINMNINTLQTLTNATAYPRYTDGLNLHAFLDVATGPLGATGGVTATIHYHDEANASQTISGLAITASTPALTICTPDWEIPLKGTGGGILTVDDFQLSAATGAASTAALVIAKQIGSIMISSVGAQVVEPAQGIDLADLYDLGASTANPALSFIYQANAAPAAAQFNGVLEFAEG